MTIECPQLSLPGVLRGMEEAELKFGLISEKEFRVVESSYETNFATSYSDLIKMNTLMGVLATRFAQNRHSGLAPINMRHFRRERRK